MTIEEQQAIIQTDEYLTALLEKMRATLVILGQNQLQVDKITMFVQNVPNTLWMPKGGETARLGVGQRNWGNPDDPIYDLPTVPVGWVTP